MHIIHVYMYMYRYKALLRGAADGLQIHAKR